MMSRNWICRGTGNSLRKGREIGQYSLCMEDGGDVEEDEAAEWVWAKIFLGPLLFLSLILSQLNKESFSREEFVGG